MPGTHAWCVRGPPDSTLLTASPAAFSDLAHLLFEGTYSPGDAHLLWGLLNKEILWTDQDGPAAAAERALAALFCLETRPDAGSRRETDVRTGFTQATDYCMLNKEILLADQGGPAERALAALVWLGTRSDAGSRRETDVRTGFTQAADYWNSRQGAGSDPIGLAIQEKLAGITDPDIRQSVTQRAIHELFQAAVGIEVANIVAGSPDLDIVGSGSDLTQSAGSHSKGHSLLAMAEEEGSDPSSRAAVRVAGTRRAPAAAAGLVQEGGMRRRVNAVASLTGLLPADGESCETIYPTDDGATGLDMDTTGRDMEDESDQQQG
jgi:hypothetical protein